MESVQAANRAVSRPNPIRGTDGFTLLEIMIALLIGAMVMGIVVVKARHVDEKRVKVAAYDFSTKIRYLYHKATLEGLYISLNIDLGNPDGEGFVQSFDAEASSDPILMAKEKSWDAFGKKGASGQKKKDAPEKKAPKPEGSAAEAAKELAEIPKTSKEPVVSELFKRSDWKEPVIVKDVWIEGSPGHPVTRGPVAIHFFPNGAIERAGINFTDPGGKVTYSVATDPLRGRADVLAEYREFQKDEGMDVKKGHK